MKKMFYILLFVFIALDCCAYDGDTLKLSTRKCNEVKAELLGAGYIYSVNYIRTFGGNQKYDFYARAGISMFGFGGWYTEFNCFPVHTGINFYVGKSSFNMGAGITQFFAWRQVNFPNPDLITGYYPRFTTVYSLSVGYSYHFNQRTNLGINYYPTLVPPYPGSYFGSPNAEWRYWPYWLGLNFGYKF